MTGRARLRATRSPAALLDGVVRWLTGSAHATYGVALMRIVFGLGIGGYVAVNFPARHALWGAGARWTTPLGGHALTSDLLLTVGCVVLLLVAVLVTVGWRARWTVPLLLLGWAGLAVVNPLLSDQGTNISRILLVYLCFADSSARWSLDARRRGSGAGAPVRNLFHNAAVLAVGAQICLVYVLSGLFKLQGPEWRAGTAVYYPLQLPQFRPWPELADLLAGSGWLVAVVTWGTLVLQLTFPLLLLHRRLRVVGVLGALTMHAGIAVVMGLPFFSLFMMAGDCVFLRDATVTRSLRRVRRSGHRSDLSV